MHISLNQIFSNSQFQALKDKFFQTLTPVQQKVAAAVTATFTLALVTLAIVRCVRHRKASQIDTKQVESKKKDEKVEEKKDGKVEEKKDEKVEGKKDDVIEQEERKEEKVVKEATKVNTCTDIIVHPTANNEIILSKELIEFLKKQKRAELRAAPASVGNQKAVKAEEKAAPQEKVVEVPLEGTLDDKVEKQVEPKPVVEEQTPPATSVCLSPMARVLQNQLNFQDNCRRVLEQKRRAELENAKKVQPTPQTPGFFGRIADTLVSLVRTS